MSKNKLPLIIMLVAGAIAVIRTYLLHYTIQQKLFYLFVTLLVFYALGCIFVYIVGRFERQNEEKLQKEEEERLAEEARIAAEEEAKKMMENAEDISTAEEDEEEEDEK